MSECLKFTIYFTMPSILAKNINVSFVLSIYNADVMIFIFHLIKMYVDRIEVLELVCLFARPSVHPKEISDNYSHDADFNVIVEFSLKRW